MKHQIISSNFNYFQNNPLNLALDQNIQKRLLKTVFLLIIIGMLQHSIDQPFHDGQLLPPKQQDSLYSGCLDPHNQPIHLPDFQVSQVIAKNQLIDIQYSEEKPFDHFLMRANQLGYDAQLVSHHTIQLDDMASIKYSFNDDNTIFQYLPPSRAHSMDGMKSPSCKKIVEKRLEKVAEMVVQLDVMRIQIWDYVSEIKQKIMCEFRKENEKWMEMFSKLQNHFQQIYQQQVEKRLKLKQETQQQISRIEELQQSKHNISLDEARRKQQIEQLQEEIKQLNININSLTVQNSQIKYELERISAYEEKIGQYQNQIHNLNVNLDQNSQYIFDLQQKIANNSLQLAEREHCFKKEYETCLQQEKEKIENNFASQFERVQQQLKQRAMEQLYHEYKLSMDNLNKSHQIQIDQLKNHYQQQQRQLRMLKSHHQNEISLLQQQRKNFIEQVRQYQIKLHELQQIQMAKRIKPKNEERLKIQELQMRIRDAQEKYRDKQTQLSYYKNLRKNDQDSFINCRPKKASNILVMDQSILDRSILKQSAISPSSALNQKYGKSREVLINNILSRIKMRQEGSIISQLHDNSFESKNNAASTLRPVSPESMLLEKEKDVRMKNISTKLEQLRSDIRRQIGMLKN